MTASEVILKDLIKRFQPNAAQGLQAIYQLQLTGKNIEIWHMKIAEGKCDLAGGPAEHPDVTISMSEEDWQAIIAGRLDALSAVFNGRIEIGGDLNLAYRLQSLFGL